MTTRAYHEWGAKLSRKILADPSKALLLDVDPIGAKRNKYLRLSSDEDWMMFPLIAEGPLVWGLDENGTARTGPLPQHAHLAAYDAGRFCWHKMPNEYPIPPTGMLKDRSKKSA